MGIAYSNLVLRGPIQTQLGDYLAHLNRTAYISPTVGDITVVYDRECEDQNHAVLARLARELSQHFSCPVLSAYVHDDGIFWYCLYRDGQFCDEYNSAPDYFDHNATELLPPSGGDATLLCSLFDSTERIAEVDWLLHYFVPGDDPPEDEPSAEERQVGIMAALGFPPFAASLGHDGIVNALGEETVLAQGFIKVTPAA